MSEIEKELPSVGFEALSRIAVAFSKIFFAAGDATSPEQEYFSLFDGFQSPHS